MDEGRTRQTVTVFKTYPIRILFFNFGFQPLATMLWASGVLLSESLQQHPPHNVSGSSPRFSRSSALISPFRDFQPVCSSTRQDKAQAKLL